MAVAKGNRPKSLDDNFAIFAILKFADFQLMLKVGLKFHFLNVKVFHGAEAKYWQFGPS